MVPDLAFVQRNASPQAMKPALTWVGHATWVVQMGGTNAVVDPIWVPAIGGVAKRKSPPGVALKDLPRLDVVCVTHNHRDHMDLWSLKRLTHAPVAVVPMGLGPALRPLGFRRVVELEWWQHTDIGHMRITLVPSQHSILTVRSSFDRLRSTNVRVFPNSFATGNFLSISMNQMGSNVLSRQKFQFARRFAKQRQFYVL